MTESSLLWKNAGVMVPCLFGHSGHTQPDGGLSTSVYRKPPHTDLYLQWDSHHATAAKYSVVSTLHHRTRTVCSNPQLLQKEEDYLQRILQENKYPIWALNMVKIEINIPSNQDHKRRNKTPMPVLHLATRGPSC